MVAGGAVKTESGGTDKWTETVALAQAAAKAEKPKEPSTPTGSKHGTERLNKTTFLSASTWDAFLPPPTNSFKVRCFFKVGEFHLQRLGSY